MKRIKGLYHIALEKISERSGWYYSLDNYADLYEVQGQLEHGEGIKGNELSFFFYPEGRVYTPFPKEYGVYYESFGVEYFEEALYFIRADFNREELSIYKYAPAEEQLEQLKAFDLKELSLYNIRLAVPPLMLTAENREAGKLEIYYPEKMSMELADRESFCFRRGDCFYFSSWGEEGCDEANQPTMEYRYYETYVVKDKSGEVIESGIGALERMPDGTWLIV